MSGSEPGEMAPESSRAVVLPKFDMHIYTSELTSSELKKAIGEYCIPPDLHPHLPPLGMMMNRLPSRYISLYIEQLEQGGLGVSFYSFFLAALTLQSLYSGFSIGCVSRVTGFLLRTRSGTQRESHFEGTASQARRHPPLAVAVAVPKLTPFQKNLEKPNPKIAAAHEKKYQLNLARTEAKRVSAEAAPEAAKKPATVEKEVVDLSGNTRASTPPGGEDDPLISHLATPVEDEFLGALSNVKDNEGLVNKLALLENDHSGCESMEKELTDGLKDLEKGRDEWQATASNHVEQIRSLEKDIEHKTHPLEIAEEKIRILKDEKLALSAKLA
ncbi:hypothetical protein Tco_1505558 [Tanacetum coccineum]